MIDVKELRIGNLIIVKPISHTDLPCKIEMVKDIRIRPCDTEYSINGFMWGSGDWVSHEPSNINPIPLTEEWLIKFGVEGNLISVGDLWIQYDEDYKCYYLADENGVGVNPDLEIKYVHQLQNIYQSLCQKELTIKE